MPQIQQPASPPALDQLFEQAASDGRISNREKNQLNRYIDSTSLSSEDKTAMKAMVTELKSASSWQFLFFEGKSKITPTEMQGLQQLAQGNSQAAGLLGQFNQALQAQQTAARDRSQATPRSEAGFEPDGVSFNGRANGVSSPSHEELYRPQWHVGQYGTGLRSENGDCGPASVAMIAKSFGFLEGQTDAESIQSVRQAVGVTETRNGGRWALGFNEIASGVEQATNGQVQHLGDQVYRPGQSENLLADIRASLDRGERPMLMTSMPGLSTGHYMVVSGFDPNGNLVLQDPSATGSTTGRTVTPQELETWMAHAVSIGRQNTLMTFAAR